MEKLSVLFLIAFVCVAFGLPLDTSDSDIESVPRRQDDAVHSIRRRFINPLFSLGSPGTDDIVKMRTKRRRRFINPLFSLGSPGTDDIVKMRTKRSEEECEKLQLCKLHARSRLNFFAAYELYFVNKENARLWDHRARSVADCEQRYGDCYDK